MRDLNHAIEIAKLIKNCLKTEKERRILRRRRE